MLANGRLMVGGRDAKGNDAIVKKHLKGDDMYLHADLHGAPSCAMQSQRGFVADERPPAYLPEGMPAFRLSDRIEAGAITEADLEQGAQLALCWSRAWGSGGGHGTVYSVKPAQVSKTAQTGEFVGAGAFIVQGNVSGTRTSTCASALRWWPSTASPSCSAPRRSTRNPRGDGRSSAADARRRKPLPTALRKPRG